MCYKLGYPDKRTTSYCVLEIACLRQLYSMSIRIFGRATELQLSLLHIATNFQKFEWPWPWHQNKGKRTFDTCPKTGSFKLLRQKSHIICSRSIIYIHHTYSFISLKDDNTSPLVSCCKQVTCAVKLHTGNYVSYNVKYNEMLLVTLLLIHKVLGHLLSNRL